MEFFCSELPWVCQQFANLDKEEWLAFILGTMVVTFFAVDHYKIPTYAKTTIGDFIELAPESLTSASRYRKGLFIYIALMFGLYLAFCFFWSQSLTTILSSFGSKIDNSALWPLAAATAVTVIGAAGDKNPIGRLEAVLRSIAHEAAYIPEAVVNLSASLNGSFPITDEILTSLGETNPDVVQQINSSQDGSLQTWIRARYLFSLFDRLRSDPEFQTLLNRPETDRAYNFLLEEYQTLSERVKQRLESGHLDLDDPLKKKVENFRSATAVLLASVLWQGSRSESSVSQKLLRLKLAISPSDHHFSWRFMVPVLGSVGATAAIAYFILYMSNWQSRGYLSKDLWHLTLAFIILLLTALFVTRRREGRLANGKTDPVFDACLWTAFVCGIPIGAAASVATYALHQGGTARFWAMFWTGLVLAVSIAFLFEFVARWAAQSPPPTGVLNRLSTQRSVRAEVRPFLIKSVALYGGSIFVLASLLFWTGQQLIVMGSPIQVANAAISALKPVIEAYKDPQVRGGDHEVHELFRSDAVQKQFSNLLWAVRDAKERIDKNDVDTSVTNAIITACERLIVPPETKLFLERCVLNTEFTRQLGEDTTWLGDLRHSSLQFQYLVINLENLANYRTWMGAVAVDWPRALLMSSLWACLAAAFAASIFVSRRNILWDGISRKTYTDYAAALGADPERWLRSPMHELNDISPLEAARYADLRATLSDQIAASRQLQPPRLKAVA